ncbi:hypothetical protein [Microbacterium sp. KR10-403]|uniref:hypothetical protein n=1 Tax=Microbacterium sp. KR10-403 TaxID=3158581 RepID=UPI0032E453D5
MSSMSETPGTTEVTLTPVVVRPNAWAVALAAVGGFAWVVSFMLWLVHSAVTDDLGYDLASASALHVWVVLLAVVGGAAFVGAITIVRLR